MFRELDTIVLAVDLLEHGLRAGDIGTVVMVHQGGEGYEAEFIALNGETVAVVTLFSHQVRSFARFEIAHVRSVSPITA